MQNSNHEIYVQKANDEMARNIDIIKNSPYRLVYHFMAPHGWINDPNGIVQYNGEYHMFYQYYPYDSQWGPIHWGHAKSKELVYWEHMPVALAPSEFYDFGNVKNYGCASGSAVIDGERIVLIYTGLVGLKQVQCIAASIDGIHFEKYAQNPVIKDYPEDGSKDFRDPTVWKHNNKWYMAIGTKKDGKGKAVLYKSKNLKKWEYIGVLAESDGCQGDMWECPDVFPIKNNYVLVISPIYDEKNGKPFFFIGDMNFRNGMFIERSFGTLDYGNDFYAPKTFIDDKCRRIMIGWMENWQSKIPSQKHGWAGAMTIPRELIIDGNDILKQKPISELERLRKEYTKLEAFEVQNLVTICELQEQVIEIIISFNILETTASVIVVQIRSSKNGKEKTEIILDLEKKELLVNIEYFGFGGKEPCKAPLNIMDDGNIILHIYSDTTSIEIFVNDGEQVITNRIYPVETSNLFTIFAKKGKVKINSIESWKLDSIWL